LNEKQVYKWLGMICILAGLMRIGMTPSALIWGSNSPQELTFGVIACVLMSIGTIVTFLVQSRETGVTGFITILAMIAGNIIMTALVWYSFVSGRPDEDPEGLVFTIGSMIAMIGFLGGTLVFTILTFWAKVFPRWVAALYLLMLLTAILPIDDNKYFPFFWGLAYVGAGSCIFAGNLRGKSASPYMESVAK